MPVDLGLTIDQAKKHFINVRKIDDAVERGRMRALSRSGGVIRKTARRSMRKARRKRKSELTDKELRIFNIRKRENREAGRPAPKRPLKHSEPGDPPRWLAKFLRDYLFYVYDAHTKSVVVGPALLGGKDGDVPRTLEEGGYDADGDRIEPRPYMGPAYDENEDRLPQFWKDSIK